MKKVMNLGIAVLLIITVGCSQNGDGLSTAISVKDSSHRRNLKYRVWQPGFYDFNIYTENKLREKLDYIHFNPVKAGIATAPSEYRFSSFYQYYKDVEQIV